MATKNTTTFEANLTKRKTLGDQLDTLDELIVSEFLAEAAPVIEKLRLVTENMSDNLSFKGRASQVLQQIENGLLRDPLAVRVIQNAQNDVAAQEAVTVKE